MKTSLVLDEKRAISELQEIISIPSITGSEKILAAELAKRLEKLGANEVILQEGEDFRANVIATFKGNSPAELLLFAHIDTVNTGDWEQFWNKKSGSDPRINPFGGADVDGAIWGRGAGDVKGGIATVLQALAHIKQNSLPLEKSVVVVFVADEESGEPGMGLSNGVKSALPVVQKKSLNPALAVYLEPTELNIYTAQMGFQIVDIEITGKTSYFGKPELGIDALKIGHQILAKLWEHDNTIKLEMKHDLIGNSSLLVTAVNAGGLIAVPGTCTISLIRKVLPGESMEKSGQDLLAVIQSVQVVDGAAVKVTFSASRDHKFGGTPFECDVSNELEKLQAIVNSHHSRISMFEGAPYWSEAPLIAHALGIDCVYWAAGDISNCHTPEERINKNDYFAAIKSLAEYLGTPWI
jgi:acetylornithine deacetylase